MQSERDSYISNKKKIMDGVKEHVSIVDFLPKEMDIEITSECNYRCVMCPHSLVGNRYAENMSLEKIKRLHNLFIHCKRVMIQGDGEPLMHPEFIAISKYISDHGCKLCTTTNLSLLNNDIALALAEQYELITVSCDAGNKDLYEYIRTNGNFEKFSKNLELLMAYADPDRVVINAVIMRQNIAFLDELLRYLSSYGIKRVVFSNLLSTDYLKNNDDSVSNLGTYAIELLSQSEKTAAELGINLIINWDYKAMIIASDRGTETSTDKIFSFDEIAEFANEYRALRTVEKKQDILAGKYHCNGICRNIYEKIYLDVQGNMMLCCYGKMRPIANIFEESFKSIWNGDIYQNCRQTFFSGNLPNFCIGCRYAMAANKYDMQEYNFKIADMDEKFADDSVFWENR